jgi:hypothetical protein
MDREPVRARDPVGGRCQRHHEVPLQQCGNTVQLPANTFGATMTALLDASACSIAAWRDQCPVRRPAGVAHTHGGNIGTTVEPYAYAMQGIDPS